MDVSSLGFRTDLAVLRLGGSEVTDHGDHLVARTPGNPTYYWGNFVLLAAAPTAEEVTGWLSLFGAVFPGARHRAFGVDGTDGDGGDLAPFVAAGLTADVGVVMTARSVREPGRPNREAVIRPLAGDSDWEQQVALSVAGEAEGYAPFATARDRTYRDMVEAGHGVWFGAFLGGRLLSSLGLFAVGGGLGRYQTVKTHPDARGLGLAGTLVHAAGSYGLRDLGLDRLVIVADPEYHAARIYRSVGFTETETQLQVVRPPVG